ncbi:DNA polymerase delta subunit 4 [Hibiscus syriacus]|uniref:DNA polymerase delta subunit 4 n=1 Tax=Hibiscus syriacus TaxID=106335 RepID=A0A6A2Y9E2_HIBSY|nr:DNA polymerase delta subunit 4 [Hibiscus syriacus]
MATTSRNIKVFYKQKKNTTTSTAKKSTKNPSHKYHPSYGPCFSWRFGRPQRSLSPPFLSFFRKWVFLQTNILRETDDFDEEEKVLAQFDMNMAYGPCLGISRLPRWERAQRMGLNPPEEIESLLKGGKVRLECLFEGRV